VENNTYNLTGIEKINKNIAYKLLENENLLRLLFYNTPDALTKPSVQETLGDNFYSIIDQSFEKYQTTHIFFTPFPRVSQDTEKVELRFYIQRIIPENIYLSKTLFGFQIVMSDKLQMLDDGINRAYLIINELLKTLNGQEIGGVGCLYFADVPPTEIIKFSDYHIGYQLFARNFSN
jgi:hypothetical protein